MGLSRDDPDLEIEKTIARGKRLALQCAACRSDRARRGRRRQETEDLHLYSVLFRTGQVARDAGKVEIHRAFRARKTVSEITLIFCGKEEEST
jgi:hypothetical protein